MGAPGYAKSNDSAIWETREAVNNGRPHASVLQRADGTWFLTYNAAMTQSQAMDVLGRLEILRSTLIDHVMSGPIQEDEEADAEDGEEA